MTTDMGKKFGRFPSFRLSHGEFFKVANARFSHISGNKVMFKDDAGNYAEVVGVKNPQAWLKKHGDE